MYVLQVIFIHPFHRILRTSSVRWFSYLQEWIGSLFIFGNCISLIELSHYFEATNYYGISAQMVVIVYALPVNIGLLLSSLLNNHTRYRKKMFGSITACFVFNVY